MTTLFEVGDVVRLKNDREAPGRRVIRSIAGAHVEYDVYYPTADKWNNKWTCTVDQLELVSRAAPPSFASCTDPGTLPACANEKPKPTRLEAACAALYEAAQPPVVIQLDWVVRALAAEIVAAAKAEAIAELAPKATAGAVCTYYRREGDDIEMTFKVRVPVDAAIACSPIHETNYTLTATSKGER